MKDVLMIIHTMGTLDPKDNDRYTYIARRILDENAGCHVEIVTSDFEHHKKTYRDKNIQKDHPFQLTFLHENEYKKNISVQRIISHYSFAVRLKKYLLKRKKPDVIYCAVPPIVSSEVVSQYAKKNNVKLIIDVQDLWPESFTIALGNNMFSKIALFPLMCKIDKVYASADEVFTVSETYSNRVKNVNKKAKVQSVYLGTDLSRYKINLTKPKNKKNSDEFWIAYVGNLGASYDFESLFIALETISELIERKIVLHIMGDGNMRKYVEQLSQRYHQNTIFYGYMPYDEMFALLKQCDIAINPIKPGTSSSVVNKVSDYAAAGIAVINTQDCEEYREIVRKYNIGINSAPGDSTSLSAAIYELYVNQEKRILMGKNNKELYKTLFDRKKTYTPIIKEMV